MDDIKDIAIVVAMGVLVVLMVTGIKALIS
jgi:hypothetical protein